MIPEDQINKRLTQLARKMGQERASALLSVLGKQKQFISAIETPVGQELLKDSVLSIEHKIELVLNEKDTPQDRAELKAYLSILRKWQKVISNYDKNQGVFKDNSM